MDNIIIVGSGGHGKAVAEAIHLSKRYTLIGFVDDKANPLNENILGHPLLGTAVNFSRYQHFAKYMVVAIGDNIRREYLCKEVLEAKFQLANVVHPRAIVSPSAVLCGGVMIMAGAVVGAEAVIGIGAIINSGAVVDHHAHVCDFGHLGVNASMAGGSVLGASAWMQPGSIISYSLKLPPGAVMAPGTVLK